MSKDMPYRVFHGGLMRCCIVSLDEYMLEIETLPKDSDKHECKYCHNEMIFNGNEDGWEWSGMKDLDKETIS